MYLYDFMLGEKVFVANYKINYGGNDEFKTDENGVTWKKVIPRGKVWYITEGTLVARFNPTYTLDLFPGQSKDQIDIDWDESVKYYIKDTEGYVEIYYIEDGLDNDNRFFRTREHAETFIRDQEKV